MSFSPIKNVSGSVGPYMYPESRSAPELGIESCLEIASESHCLPGDGRQHYA